MMGIVEYDRELEEISIEYDQSPPPFALLHPSGYIPLPFRLSYTKAKLYGIIGHKNGYFRG